MTKKNVQYVITRLACVGMTAGILVRIWNQPLSVWVFVFLFYTSFFVFFHVVGRDAARELEDLLPKKTRPLVTAGPKYDGGHEGSDSPYWPSKDETPWR
jgi:hypothetical protein